ncbi:MAG: hypothetical protein ACI96G_000671, partial [Flavobacterium sp.]
TGLKLRWKINRKVRTCSALFLCFDRGWLLSMML